MHRELQGKFFADDRLYRLADFMSKPATDSSMCLIWATSGSIT